VDYTPDGRIINVLLSFSIKISLVERKGRIHNFIVNLLHFFDTEPLVPNALANIILIIMQCFLKSCAKEKITLG